MHAIVFSQMITNLVFSPSSPTSLAKATADAVARKLDDGIRSDLQNLGWLGHTFFWWLIASSIVVAIGVAFEGPEIIHDLTPIVRRWFRKSRPTRPRGRSRFREDVIKVAGFIGWLFVVVGVVGEGVFEGMENRAQGMLQTFNDILLTDAQRQTVLAIDRAGDAADNALDAQDSAQKATDDLSEADKKLASVFEKASDLERYLGIRKPAFVSAKTRKAVSDFKDGLVYFTSDSDGESMQAATLIQGAFFPHRDWVGPKIGMIGLMNLVGENPPGILAPSEGIKLWCGVRNFIDINGVMIGFSEREKRCFTVENAIADDLINSGIAATTSAVPNDEEAGLVIQVWPKPSYETTQQLIKAYRASKKKPAPKTSFVNLRP
ncbi:MAG: hypothetical protein WBE41_14420 [Terracidiphilus sp.]